MEHPVPVVRLLVVNEGRVLVLRRAASRFGEGAWCLPGGKVDYGDTVAATVAKELREETGLVVTAAQFLCYQDSLPSETGAMHCLNLYFECVATGDLRLNEESSEARWIGPDEVAELELVFRNGEALAAWFSRR